MSAETEPNYREMVGGLNLTYIRQAGESLSAKLFPKPKGIRQDDGTVRLVTPYAQPAGLAYQPGNGTNYSLVFVPVRSIQQTSSEVNASNGDWSVPEGVFNKDGSVGSSWVLVVKCNGTRTDFAHPFRLGFGEMNFVSYVVEHTGLNYADGCAVTALLRAIAGVEVLS